MKTQYATMADLVGGWTWVADIGDYDNAVDHFDAYRRQGFDAAVIALDRADGTFAMTDITDMVRERLRHQHEERTGEVPDHLWKSMDVIDPLDTFGVAV